MYDTNLQEYINHADLILKIIQPWFLTGSVLLSIGMLLLIGREIINLRKE